MKLGQNNGQNNKSKTNRFTVLMRIFSVKCFHQHLVVLDVEVIKCSEYLNYVTLQLYFQITYKRCYSNKQ